MSATVKMNLENHIVPVTDVDRAKGFYQQLGWRLDDDVAPMDGLRFVQFTPPGSPAAQPATAGGSQAVARHPLASFPTGVRVRNSVVRRHLLLDL